MKLFRIASSGTSWLPADMSGAGAAAEPGRWNGPGEHVIYAAPSLAMAILETAAHIDDGGLPLNKYVIEIEVPPALWASRRALTPAALPGGWDAIPHGLASISAGSAWLKSGSEAILELPSVIAPEETVVLINASHADAKLLSATATRRFQYNLLFRPR